MPRVFIADPSLTDHRGHHFGLTETISDTCVDQNLEPIWLVNRRFELSPEDFKSKQILLTFSNATYDGHLSTCGDVKRTVESTPMVFGNRTSPRERLRFLYRRLPSGVREMLTPMTRKILAKLRYRSKGTNSLDANESDNSLRPDQELYGALNYFESTSEDIVLFHTCDAETYRDVLSFFANTAAIAEWTNLPVFHLCTPYDENIMPHNKRILGFEHSVRRLKNLDLIGKRIFMHAENELLADHLSTYLDLKVSTLPIPPFKSLVSNSRLSKSSSANIMYLGAARTEKGFVNLPTIVDECLSRGLDVRFTLQITPPILGYTPDVEHAVARLKSMDSDRLQLLEAPLSQPVYKKTLAATDIMLLCYEPDRYAVRSSGIAVEAILSEAIIISSRNTFPAYIAGDAGVQVDNLSEITDAIAFVCSNKEQFRSGASSRKQWYLHSHGGKKFVDNITRCKGVEIESCMGPGRDKYIDETNWKKLI